LRNTVTDGDCGLDAFLTSALACPALCSKANRNPFQTLRQKRKLDQLTSLRRTGCKYIQENCAEELWDGFSLGDLIRVVSNATLPAYLEKMKHKGCWVDTPFLHALACAFDVDVVVMQPSGVALVGASLREGKESLAVVPVALANDFHFWALVPDSDADVSHSGQHSLPEDDEDTVVECVSGGLLPADRVTSELNLVQRLQYWNPWECPTEELNTAPLKQLSTHNQVPRPCLVFIVKLLLSS
jgi:hypothetical protein